MRFWVRLIASISEAQTWYLAFVPPPESPENFPPTPRTMVVPPRLPALKTFGWMLTLIAWRVVATQVRCLGLNARMASSLTFALRGISSGLVGFVVASMVGKDHWRLSAVDNDVEGV